MATTNFFAGICVSTVEKTFKEKRYLRKHNQRFHSNTDESTTLSSVSTVTPMTPNTCAVTGRVDSYPTSVVIKTGKR